MKKNLQRTFDSWSSEFVTRGGNALRSQALFALAWFHAVVQERRTFIPQVSRHGRCRVQPLDGRADALNLFLYISILKCDLCA